MVLAFFYIKYDVPLLPLTVGGAIVSGLGRLVLARMSRAVASRVDGRRRDDIDALGRLLNRFRQHAGVAVFLYALSPLPTNHLFVAAGMVGLRMAWVLAGFWAARILADTFWVWTTDRVFTTLGDVFEGAFGSWVVILLQSLSLASVILLYLLPWGRLLRRWAPDDAAR
jgi:hypothetical protein